jgi:hypothetical protein
MRIRRLGLKDAFEKLPPCIGAMGACLSAHSDSTPSLANGSRSKHEGREAPSEPGAKRLICSTLMSAFSSSRQVDPWLSFKRVFWAALSKAGGAAVMATVDHTLRRGLVPHDR